MKSSVQELFKIIKNIYKVMGLVIQSSKHCAILLIVINILVGLLAPLNLIIWKYVIDAAINSISGGTVVKVLIWLGIWAISNCGINLASRISSYYKQLQSSYMGTYITSMILEKIERLELSYFDIPGNYDKAEKANSESVNNALTILSTIIMLIQAVTSITTSIIVLMMLDYKVILICICSIIPVFIIDLKNYEKEYEIYNSRVPKLRYIRYLRGMMLKYENIKEIKVARANVFFKKQILDNTYKYIEEDKRLKKFIITRQTIVNVLQNFLSYINKAYVIFLFWSIHLSIGDLTLYINSLESLETEIRSILGAFSSIYNNNLYIDNLFIFLEEPEAKCPLEVQDFPRDFKEIRFEHVYFKYPEAEKYSLEDVNLTIKRNNIYAIVGENGSGKSTLIKLFMGLYEPTQGKIYIDDIEVGTISKESLFKNIGVIFQDFMKYPLTVKENIGVGCIEEIDNEVRIIEASKQSGANQFIEKFSKKYETQLQKQWHGGADLSIGQWQKIAISRALMARSLITILDEPTAALDPKAEYELFNNLKQLMIGKTCLFITHRFSNVQLAHEIIVVENGTITEVGCHKDLLNASGSYAELYRLQAESYVS